MRRLPGWIWLFTPLVLALLYAAGHALFAPAPTLANLAPPEAILVQRFRNLDTLDRVSFGPRGPQVRPIREVLAEERNVPGLPGVDHTAPIHLVLLPRGTHQDATLAIFRVDDPGRFEDAFMRTDFLERRLIRHAQHLHLRGGWAAVGPNEDAPRRIGMGSLSCEDLGEDYALAARIPELVGYAMETAKQYPWRGVLEALGVEPDKTQFVHLPEAGEVRTIIPGAARVDRLRQAWKTARLWGWMDDGRIRLDLELQDGPLAAALAARGGVPEPGSGATAGLQAPADALAWLRVPIAADRPLLAQALLACGVRFVGEAAGDAAPEPDLLGGLGAPVPARASGAPVPEAGLLLWATRGIGTGFAWTVGVAAEHGRLPPLGAFLPALPQGDAQADLPEGAAPLTKGDTTEGRPTPVGRLAAALAVPSNHASWTCDVVTFGPSAREALEGMKNHLGLPAAQVGEDPRAAWDPGEGMALLASFFVRTDRAQALLGKALEPGGVLAPLAGGDLRGALYTDGTRLRLLLRLSP